MIDYSKIASDYATHRRIHPGVLNGLISDGRLGNSSRVLEVGCGTGNYIATLNQVVNCQSYGIDRSQEMLTVAKERFPFLTFQLGRAEKLDFGNGYFDLVFSVDVIHHIAERSSYFREAHRVLKHGGRVCTVTESEWMLRNRRPQSAYFPETVAVELRRYPAISEMKLLMREAGFSEIIDKMVELRYDLTDLESYRRKVLSSLLLLSEEDFQRGLILMEKDLAKGPIPGVLRYALVWGTNVMDLSQKQ